MMQHIWRRGYAWVAAPLMEVVAPLIARNNQNLQAGLQGRQGLWQRLEQQLAGHDPNKPLIWFHVASAGEFLQAQPVLERCLQQGLQCAVTYTSVNGYKWLQRTKFPQEQRPLVTEYLPLDTVSNMRRFLRVLKPTAIVYIRYDLWPNLVWEAHDAGIPQYLISATIQPQTKRFTSLLGRSLYRSLYACLDGIFTVTEEDRQRFLVTNPEHPNIQVVGDTRFDSVLDRRRNLAPPQLPEGLAQKFVCIVGSSWPPDEECIFPALKDALGQYPDLALILAPHEPTEAHLAHPESFFQEFSMMRLTRLPENISPLPRILLVDTIGVLSSLYKVGTLAYIGGAFTTGVHNVMEPAVMGLPVLFGPIHYNSPEALDLLQRGFAFTVSEPQDFHRRLFYFLEHPNECKQLGQQARQLIESQAGAADRCFTLITHAL